MIIDNILTWYLDDTEISHIAFESGQMQVFMNFSSRSIRAWNSLPQEITAILSQDTFRLRDALAPALRKGTVRDDE